MPAWYLRALTLCLCAVNVRTRSPVSASQHLTVLSALPEYTCWFASWGGRGGRFASWGGAGRSAQTLMPARGGSDAPPSLSRSKRGAAKLRELEAPLRGRGSGALPPPARRTRLLPSPQGGAAGARLHILTIALPWARSPALLLNC